MDEFMKEAFLEAKKGLDEGGIPIGAVLVKNGRIIGRGHNRRVQKKDITAHAEIDCIRNAGNDGEHGKDRVLYSTLSPCYMCSGAAVLFKIPKIVFAENRNFVGGEDLLKRKGVELINLDDSDIADFFAAWIKKNRALWEEDIDERSGV
jgi:cytosine/creatinine deaminase